MAGPKKSLGQHWLSDRDILNSIADEALLTPNTTVLEIGPGLGTLTSILLKRAGKVVAVEFDPDLARKLPGQFPGTMLEVVNEDILTFDLGRLPAGYTVVANVPYYITSKIVQRLMTSDNKPARAVLLVQKEVAERLAAKPGDMSVLAISAQVYADVTLGPVVEAEYFTPPPKVDSQVVVLATRQDDVLGDLAERAFFRTVKAGFGEKRKMLRSSLSGGLAIGKDEAVQLLANAHINPEARAEALSVDDWITLATAVDVRQTAV